MFIQTEDTPNPATLKFIPGRAISENGNKDFPTVESAKNAPLALRLFAIEGVVKVFYGGDFVTVTKASDKDWQVLKPLILAGMAEHFVTGAPIFSGEEDQGQAAEEDNEIVAQIKDLLETRVRPAVAQDGGDIVFHSFEDGIVYLHMQGSCAGCPSSTATLKMGIENMLRHYVPEVTEVRPV